MSDKGDEPQLEILFLEYMKPAERLSRTEQIRRLTLLCVPTDLWEDQSKMFEWILEHHPKVADIMSRLKSISMTGDYKELQQGEKAFSELEEYMQQETTTAS